ncbi:hypothetical protein R1flu_022808 [Riccia fluitans]|uniref:Glycosyl transferase CAP10 domain-containing protein n=1 Tax=Riccia fluitans TaxID=41844 RepID=A0ABD1XT61_9MARC
MKRTLTRVRRFLGMRAPGSASRFKKAELHSAARLRSWPLLYYLGILLCLILIPPLVFNKTASVREEMLHAATIFGDNVDPTPWHWHLNPLGPEAFNWKRYLKIKQCSLKSWILPPPRTLSSVEMRPKNTSCPQYFQWIHSDLSPWVEKGISKSNIEMAREHAAFRVTIVKGNLYLNVYYSCVQTRALFTVWGLLLLLEKYKGLVPDVDLMFDCMDRPLIEKTQNFSYQSPPPLFRYCSTKSHYDIPFPDWSFWGWKETKLEPWDQQREKIVKASAMVQWKDKIAKAFWRGNPDVGSPLRMQLIECQNRAEVQNQNWASQQPAGQEYDASKLENQCKHRYKIYAEGYAWSVSFKYIMACGSPTLVISPRFHDFFMRGLQPWVHYIPVRPSEICAQKLCRSIDSAVKWGESKPSKAVAVGKAGEEFLRTELNMNNVYDYMFHLISEYARLQTFKPVVPEAAEVVTESYILCLAEPQFRSVLQKSRESLKVGFTPCIMPQSTKEILQDTDWAAKEHATVEWAEKECEKHG